MEEKVRKAHVVARELADGAGIGATDRWLTVYNNVFAAMLAGTFANPLPDADKQPEGE